MKDFFSKEEYTEQDINNLISNKAEETITSILSQVTLLKLRNKRKKN